MDDVSKGPEPDAIAEAREVARARSSQVTRTDVYVTGLVNGKPRVVREVANTARRQGERVGRNDKCPCGSGKKYKKCHGAPAISKPHAPPRRKNAALLASKTQAATTQLIEGGDSPPDDAV